MRATLLRRRPYALALAVLAATGVALIGASTAGATSSATLTVVTDASWTWTETDGSHGAAVVLPHSCYPGYNAWGSAIPDHWIWTNDCLQGDGESATFTKTFTVPGLSVTSASARFAVDNHGTLAINGHTVVTRTDPGFYSGNSGSTDVTAYVHPGANTLTVFGANTPSGGAAPGVNPAGVSAIVTVQYTVDDTAPTASPAASPAANANGWNASPVTVAWNWADEAGGSGIDSSACPSTTSSGTQEGAAIVLTATCKDLAGNTGNATYTVNVDGTRPSDSPVVSPAANGAGWNNSDVTIDWNWTDAGSGIDPASCTQSSTSAGEGAIELSSTCRDLAGNPESDSVTVNVDEKDPVVTYSGNAGTYTADQTVSISCSASDALSGVASDTCADVSGPAYSFGPGAHAYSATATDAAGNTGSASTSFTVTVDATSLCALVHEFVSKHGIANSLCVKLRAAAAAAARGHSKTQANDLRAFAHEVRAQSGKALTADHAALLIRLAAAL